MANPEAVNDQGVDDSPYTGLVTIRMIRLFVILRRGTLLSLRSLFGLSEIEWRIMVQVGDTDQLSLNGLAEAMLQDRGQLSRAVKAMVARGLLTRERKPGGPEICIGLSDLGRKLHSDMIDFVVRRDKRMTADIDPDDLAALWRVIEIMTQRSHEMLEEENSASA